MKDKYVHGVTYSETVYEMASWIKSQVTLRREHVNILLFYKIRMIDSEMKIFDLIWSWV
jgi:hypothetical protein